MNISLIKRHLLNKQLLQLVNQKQQTSYRTSLLAKNFQSTTLPIIGPEVKPLASEDDLSMITIRQNGLAVILFAVVCNLLQGSIAPMYNKNVDTN
jgi:hypothetical protein